MSDEGAIITSGRLLWVIDDVDRCDDRIIFKNLNRF